MVGTGHGHEQWAIEGDVVVGKDLKGYIAVGTNMIEGEVIVGVMVMRHVAVGTSMTKGDVVAGGVDGECWGRYEFG